jgi:hypothetical protein
MLTRSLGRSGRTQSAGDSSIVNRLERGGFIEKLYGKR